VINKDLTIIDKDKTKKKEGENPLLVFSSPYSSLIVR
jgi:hypothetical protein